MMTFFLTLFFFYFIFIMISCLPLELFELVHCQLSTLDKYRCLYVCQAWYSLFRLALYQNCVLSNQASYRTLYTTLQQRQDLGFQVKQVDLNKCEVSLQELQILFQLCPNIRYASLRWPSSSFLGRESECMWDQHRSPVWPAIDTNFTDIPSTSWRLCSLTQLTLHDTDMDGLFGLVTRFPLLEQFCLVSSRLDMTLDDLESIHIACPRLTSLALDIHTLLSTDSKSSSSSLVTMDQLRSLKLIYKQLQDPGRTPWIRYLAQKYPHLTSLEMQTRFVRRRHMTTHLEDSDQQEVHPFQQGLKQWAQSCHFLERIHFTNISWDQWFLQHLPSSSSSSSSLYKADVRSLQQVHVVRMDDGFDPSFSIFWTLVNHPFLNQLTNLTIRPVATHPDSSFYKAIGRLGFLTTLTIQQQGHRSNKQSPCHLDIHSLLHHCSGLTHLTLGGLALSTSEQRMHSRLDSLVLSTVELDHRTLDDILASCLSLTRLTMISCEYTSSSVGVPTLAILSHQHRWKHVEIRYPFIQASTSSLIGLRRGPLLLSIKTGDQPWTHHDAFPKTQHTGDHHHTFKDLCRVKIVCHSIRSLHINGIQIYI
ncbi:uncharacterized protein BX664DRAFT_335063 [Halteromyces radiatus]|uniref:uncharacterized protein n=1 Tax=Halteromyces radiatus TaxID=101107 RepID=UPI00221EF28C|nr:uncharacterized protein BX664DRAFT_335063 [Halteromyces radiatus]KAI8086157.1 hypothetical protein BX664DRAFT_335063 [Halteromyces radiatus]